MKSLLRMWLAWAVIFSSSLTPVPVGARDAGSAHDHGAHDHGANDHGANDHEAHDHSHGESSLEDRFRKSVQEMVGFDIGGHEGSEGPMLEPEEQEHTTTLFGAQGCPSQATVKEYDILAIQVVQVVNRWGDRDPEAYMFALRDQLPAIRAQEALADDEGAAFGLSLGLGADPIQPLTLRANVGDCVRITFRNEIDQPASFHVHGADLILSETGEPALSTNADTVALPMETVEYQWYVDPTYYRENTHYIHAHGPKARFLVSHGLFGALVVEPAESVYFDQRSGEPLCTIDTGRPVLCRNSWDAIISPGDGTSDYREYVVFYHEIGNAKFTLVDKEGMPHPSIDPIAQSYKPNGRALNYRSEAFWRRLGEMEDAVGFGDEAEAYSTYAFGDPATPIPQSYLGDPAKFRLVHGGSETFHVPHLHGGGIQWQRQQDIGKDGDPGYTPFDAGLKKDFHNHMPSSGNDSQTIGPSETYELEISCGSGGCQQTVGDFLFHCHVASHYISGMWHFWRVYNTLQDGASKTDDLAIVAELPDRVGGAAAAVTSQELLGKRIDFAGRDYRVDTENLAAIVESQLPPAGVPNNVMDAAVWNWTREGTTYFGEPETEESWPNFSSPTPGERPRLMFDPLTGKMAFPLLRPHLGQRPPFAPNHGPAPYLEPVADNERGEPARPGANGEASLCPSGAPQRLYKIHAIQTDIPVTSDKTDEKGMLFVVQENEALARGDPQFKVPLAMRANQGDCVDIIFVNELEETGERAELSKTNIHIHFVQFDTQASDGVISGASYEQAPRPFIDPEMSYTIVGEAPPGAERITLDDASSFHVGSAVGIGMDQSTKVFETAVIQAIEGNTLLLRAPLKHAHAAGEKVSVEYVRYRWYVARQNGAIYFHDHVDALNRWGHGLFGALIAEPTGSTWHHPATGDEILSGTAADIRVDPQLTVVPGLNGSFREFVLFMSDDNPLTGSAFNLRAEPLFADTARGQESSHLMLSSVLHGDPHTPLLSAYVGDPIMLRLLTSATEEIHPFHITGHRFRWERFQPDSPQLTSFGVGISERFNAYIEAAGGVARRAGDYLYYNGTERHFTEGSWGILRVHDTQQPHLQSLPGRQAPQGPGFPQLTYTGQPPPTAVVRLAGGVAMAGDICPPRSPRRSFAISAIERELIFNDDAGLRISNGRMFVLDQDLRRVDRGGMRPEPLVVRANVGDCVTLQLTNLMQQPASINLDALVADPADSLGITVGYNPDQAAQPGETILYRYYADQEIGVVRMRDFGDPQRSARQGLYGALVVEPANATYVDPYTGDPLNSGVSAVIQLPRQPDFREFVTVFQDNDPDIGLFLMPYDEEVNRTVGVNYRAEPLALRLEAFDVVLDSDRLAVADMPLASALYDVDSFGVPETGIFEAYAGDPVRFRAVSASSEQPQVFYVEGHEWQLTPQLEGSDVVSSRYLPSGGVLNIELMQTGGPQQRPGTYQWANHRLPFEKAGQWGLMKILDNEAESELLPLVDRPARIKYARWK